MDHDSEVPEWFCSEPVHPDDLVLVATPVATATVQERVLPVTDAEDDV